MLWRCGGRQCGAGECEHDEETLHRDASGGGPAHAPPSVRAVLTAPGSPLPAGVLSPMESSLGHDFADVRVHTDTLSAQSARDVQARAYTVGRHIAFAAGQFNPQTRAGRRLIAHELTHAAAAEPAMSPLPPGPIRVSSPQDAGEEHAVRSAEHALAELGDEPSGQL